MQTNNRLLVIDIAKRTYSVFENRVMIAHFEDEDKKGPLLPVNELEQIRTIVVQDKA
jgi:hypothetical protein